MIARQSHRPPPGVKTQKIQSTLSTEQRAEEIEKVIDRLCCKNFSEVEKFQKAQTVPSAANHLKAWIRKNFPPRALGCKEAVAKLCEIYGVQVPKNADPYNHLEDVCRILAMPATQTDEEDEALEEQEPEHGQQKKTTPRDPTGEGGKRARTGIAAAAAQSAPPTRDPFDTETVRFYANARGCSPSL